MTTRHPPPPFSDLTHEAPRKFYEVAARYGLAPEYLAKIVCEDFAERAPARLLIISRAAVSSALETVAAIFWLAASVVF